MFTIGCDPEIFLTKRGKAVSAHGMIPGDKKNPHPVPNGAIQVDGLAVEFNTAPVPLADFASFNENICRVLHELKAAVKKTDADVSFALVPTMDFDPEYLAAQPDEAKELGCDPDYSAYTLKPNPRPNGEVPFRTASGHIHVGWGADIPVDNQEHLQICADFVKMLDATVGLFMTDLDRDPRRRELYGKAGAFRPKPYGVEYRTPSNVWLRSKATRKMVWRLMSQAVHFMQGGRTVEATLGITSEGIQRIIDTGDYGLARHLLTQKIFGRYTADYNNTCKYIDNLYAVKEVA